MLIFKDSDDFDTPSAEDTLKDINKEGDDEDKDTDDASDDEDTSTDDEDAEEGADDEEEEESGADEDEDEDESESEDDEDTDEDEDEESEEDSEDSEDEGEDDDEEDDENIDPKKVKGKTVSMLRFLKRGQKIKDLKKELVVANKKAEKGGKEGEAELESTLEKLAEEHKVDPKFIKGFAKAILGKTGVPESVTTGLKILTDEAEKTNQRRHATNAWKKEILPLFNEEYPDATPKMKRKAEELFVEKALDPEYFGIKKLPMLYKGDDSFRNIFKKKGKKSGESTGGKTGRKIVSKGKKDLTDPEADKKWDLTNEEHDEWTENRIEAQGDSGRKLIRRSDNIR